MKWIREGTDALSVGELTIYCVETTFGEVCNGGIEQYLGNESGLLAKHCPAALQRVGLLEYAQIMREAIERCQCIPVEIVDDDPRSPFVEWIPIDQDCEEPFKDLEKHFFERYFGDKTEFRRKLFKYIADNEAEFVTSPS